MWDYVGMPFPVFAPRPPVQSSPESSRTPANTRVPTVLGRGASAYGRKHEVAALVLWTVALFLALALASYRGDPAGAAPPVPTPASAAWVGPVGEAVARGLVSLIGVVAWSLPFELFVLGIPLVRGKPSPVTPGRVAGDLLLAIVTAALVEVGGQGRTAFGTHSASGLVGEVFGELARSLFSTAGSFLVGFACLGLILIGRAEFSFIALARLVVRIARRVAGWIAAAARAVAEAWKRARDLERERRDIARLAREPRIDVSHKDEAIVAALPFDMDDGLAGALVEEGSPPPRPRRKPRETRQDSKDSAPPATPSPPEEASALREPAKEEAAMEADVRAVEPEAIDPTAQAPTAEASPKAKRVRKAAPTIVDTSAALEKEQIAPEEGPGRKAATFDLPSMDLLVAEQVDPSLAIDRDKLLANAQKLVETLAHYGVQGKVEDILPGPTVTTYEVSPAAGTKVSKVAASPTTSRWPSRAKCASSRRSQARTASGSSSPTTSASGSCCATSSRIAAFRR